MVIEEEADRLTQLIDNLLDASRLQAGGLKLNLSDVALDQMARQLVKKFRTQTTLHELSAEFPPSFPVIQADAARLEQVLSNLIGNSIKYSPKGGAVRIVCSRESVLKIFRITGLDKVFPIFSNASEARDF
jgi:K+-sensing histidine kinase KdpD